MQVARNDIVADEKDVAATRKDSQPPGKGFTGSRKITAVREKFYGAEKYVAVARKYVAAAGKWFTAAGKKVLQPSEKKVTAAREICRNCQEMCHIRRKMVHSSREKGFMAIEKKKGHGCQGNMS